MLNVIEFLEKVGQDSQLRRASPDKLQLALDSAGVDSELRAAIVAGDQAKLEALLGQSPLCGYFLPGKEDEKEDDEREDSPAKEPAESPEHSDLHVVSQAA